MIITLPQGTCFATLFWYGGLIRAEKVHYYFVALKGHENDCPVLCLALSASSRCLTHCVNCLATCRDHLSWVVRGTNSPFKTRSVVKRNQNIRKRVGDDSIAETYFAYLYLELLTDVLSSTLFTCEVRILTATTCMRQVIASIRFIRKKCSTISYVQMSLLMIATVKAVVNELLTRCRRRRWWLITVHRRGCLRLRCCVAWRRWRRAHHCCVCREAESC